MTDAQLEAQIQMLRANKEMAKMAFANRPGAPPMDDAQLDMMLSMMTPQMMRMSMNFAKQNPDIIRQQMGGAAAPAQAAQANTPADQINSNQADSLQEMMGNETVRNMLNSPEAMKFA